MPEVVTLEAPAKVNLRLCVLQREQSGYHALESIFCAVSLSDRLTARRGESGIRLQVGGDVETGPVRENLVWRAAESFYAAAGRPPAVEMLLEKGIPSRAGLGGGSSDAAAALRALNALEGEPLGREELLQLGIGLGADVPFFLCGSTLALGWSRGERLLSLPALPARPVLIAHPGRDVSTAESFAALRVSRVEPVAPRASVLDHGSLTSWQGLATVQGNDFQPIVEAAIPELGPPLRVMADCGAAIALLAGSGGCCFGVFESRTARDAAAEQIQSMGLQTWRCGTLEEMPAPGLHQPR